MRGSAALVNSVIFVAVMSPDVVSERKYGSATAGRKMNLCVHTFSFRRLGIVTMVCIRVEALIDCGDDHNHICDDGSRSELVEGESAIAQG